MRTKSVVFIGAGGLAWSMCSALYASGASIIQVISPSVPNGQKLAQLVGAKHETSVERIANADFYFIALPDRLIESAVSSTVFPEGSTIIHCSGSIPLSALSTHSVSCGVLYPFQTFTRGRVVPFKDIPLFVEASDASTLNSITQLASSISGSVTPINSEQRRALHLAGVFSNNFTNFLMQLSSEWMVKNGFSLHLLQPLMAETIRKAFELTPALSQTGPAVRNDISVLDLHTKMLADMPQHLEVYRLFSELIIQKAKESINNDTKADE